MLVLKNQYHKFYAFKRQGGSSMLEALIAMVIILMGVLGAAGIQMLSINNTKNAEYQGVAAIVASNMVTAIQGNPSYWLKAGGKTITVNGTAVTVNGTAVSGGIDCKSATCTPDQMASYDLSTWGASVATTVPSGTATIVCNTASPVGCTILLNWLVKNVANLKAASSDADASHLFASGTVRARTYQTMVIIR